MILGHGKGIDTALSMGKSIIRCQEDCIDQYGIHQVLMGSLNSAKARSIRIERLCIGGERDVRFHLVKKKLALALSV